MIKQKCQAATTQGNACRNTATRAWEIDEKVLLLCSRHGRLLQKRMTKEHWKLNRRLMKEIAYQGKTYASIQEASNAKERTEQLKESEHE